MTLRFKLQLVMMVDDEEVSVDEVVGLDKQNERLEHLGLSLAEAKTLLVELQRQVLTRQVEAFVAAHMPCPSCSRPRGIKDRKSIVFRTLFGNLELASPRLRRCPCQHDGPFVILSEFYRSSGAICRTRGRPLEEDSWQTPYGWRQPPQADY